MEKKPYGTVLIKAAKLLDYIAENPNQTLQTISNSINLTQSTALKILDTLVLISYVQKSQGKTYSLGGRIINYTSDDPHKVALIEMTQPYLAELQQTIDETIHLGIVKNDEIFYIDKLEPKNQSIRMSSRIGITRPLYSSAMGKAALAEYSAEELMTYLDTHQLVAFTEKTITEPLSLKNELIQINQRKVAFDDEEMELEIFCFGASLMVAEKVVGTFSVSMPKYRLTPTMTAQIIQAIQTTKNKIEQKLM